MTSSDRRWLEIAARCTANEEIETLLAEALVSLGGRAVVEEDGWQVTHLEEPEDAEGAEAWACAEMEALTGRSDLEVRIRWQEHEDWAESWKRGLAPRRITDRLVVRPSWTDFEAKPTDLVIVLDPGMAFGTAEHGTTRGSLRLLDAVLSQGETILDIGSGSGILSVAAALLGAADVLAIEGDRLACEALAENVTSNRVSDRVRHSVEWADSEKLAKWGPVDGVIANIESGQLRPLLDGFHAALRPGGWLILSGILAEEWDGMRSQTEQRHFVFQAVDADGEWRSALFKRKA
jgi:ribosomal protein L11 methyltransferase